MRGENDACFHCKTSGLVKVELGTVLKRGDAENAEKNLGSGLCVLGASAFRSCEPLKVQNCVNRDDLCSGKSLPVLT